LIGARERLSSVLKGFKGVGGWETPGKNSHGGRSFGDGLRRWREGRYSQSHKNSTRKQKKERKWVTRTNKGEGRLMTSEKTSRT